ncbi:DUF4113 domain-containing protein, partial [Prevotella sp. SGI.027]
NQFREDQQQYWNSREVTLLTPSNSTQQIVQAAAKALQEIFVPGLQYKKAGVVVMGIMSDSAVQTNFIDYNRDKMEKQMRLDQVIDHLNKLGGPELVVLGAQQYREKDEQGHHVAFTDAIRHDFKSKNPTTRWSDIITLK